MTKINTSTKPISKVIIILGMHRSGTSALTGSLQQQGVYLGDVFEWNPFNQKGNRENAEIMKLNDKILQYSDGSWNDPPALIKWSKEDELTRDDIICRFTEGEHTVWGFKDPRTLLTHSFWLQGLENAHVKYVGSFRHPIATVKSLISRDNMSPKKGFSLWEKYNSRLLSLQQMHKFPLISYDLEASEYQQAVFRILEMLGLQQNHKVEEVFFDNSLRHQYADYRLEVPDSALSLYTKLLQIYKEQAV